MNEMNKLIKLLATNNLPFEVTTIGIGKTTCEGSTIQVCAPDAYNFCIDAVCHFGSYGGKDGLLEIMVHTDPNPWFDEWGDDVRGYLTAEEALPYFSHLLKD